MLEQHAEEMIAHIPAHAVVVELGCGSATKTAILQRCLLKRYKAFKNPLPNLPTNVYLGSPLLLKLST